MLKLHVNFGDQLSQAKIIYPKFLPVMRNGKCVGEAIMREDGMAELNIVNQQQICDIKHILELGVGGIVTSQKGDIITEFNLRQVSIEFKQRTKK